MDLLKFMPSQMASLSAESGSLWRALSVVLTLFATLLLPVATLGQESKSVVWADVDVTVTLREDSTLHIAERNRIDFTGGPFRRGGDPADVFHRPSVADRTSSAGVRERRT